MGYQVRYVYRAFVRALADELGSHGITTSQWSALRVLWEAEGLSQVELAQRMMVEKASLTGCWRHGDQRGLITRNRNAEDRRKVNILPDSPRSRLKDKLLPYRAKINRKATRGMTTEEVETLRRLLAQGDQQPRASDQFGRLRFGVLSQPSARSTTSWN